MRVHGAWRHPCSSRELGRFSLPKFGDLLFGKTVLPRSGLDQGALPVVDRAFFPTAEHDGSALLADQDTALSALTNPAPIAIQTKCASVRAPVLDLIW